MATTAVRQVYANELFSQVAQAEEGKVLALLRVSRQALGHVSVSRGTRAARQ